MSDPALALQDAVLAALEGSDLLKQLLADPVPAYDRVPDRAVMPYITITGGEQLVDDGNACGDAWECFHDVHVWSDKPGRPQAKEIAAAVRGALSTELPIDGFRIVEGLHQTTRYFDDPDPTVTHAVVTFRYLVEPA